MTAQEVIKSFMAKLTNHGYTSSSNVGTNMLNDAVKASSDFLSIQNVIDSMKADQISAEREAVEEVLSSAYAGKTLSDLSSSIKSASAKTYDTENKGNAYFNSNNDSRTTVERLIKERKAYIFLEKYCGIQLENNFWITSSNSTTAWTGDTTGNIDTGAITGSDANISLKAGDEFYGATLTSDLMTTLAQQDGVSLSGDTLIVGTGIEKTRESVVPETGNMYTASTAQAQNISTGSHDWIVVTGDANDTIVTGGADSIVAGGGNDKITVGADYASIVTGAGSDTVEISSEVTNVTLGDLDSSDTLTISGTFQVGTAQIEDTLLVVTDKTGTRQIRLGDLDNAKNARVNGTTIATWLSNAGININSLSSTSSANVIEDAGTEVSISGGGRIAIDDEYQPAQIRFANAAEETQNIATNANGAVKVNLDDVTITEGNITAGSTKVGVISSEFPNVSSFTKNGLTINLLGVTSDKSGGTGNIKSKTLDELTDDQKTIVAGLFKWWAKECLNLNEDSYGIGFKSSTAMVNDIGLYFFDSGSSGTTLATVWNTTSGNKTIGLKLNVNMNYYNGISADNVNGESSKTTAFLDRTLSHEFTHAVMSTNIQYFNSLPQFIKEGMAELTHGIDDERGSRIFDLAYDASRLNTALSLTNTSTGTSDAYAGGYMFLRYFARQAALQSLVDYDPTTDTSWSVTKNNNDSTATCTIGGVVVATIKGLVKGLAAKGTTIDGITVSGNTITLSKNVLGTNNVTLTSNDYTLAIGDDLADNIATISNKAWTVSKGTATLKGNLTAGYSLSETGKTITYTAAKNNQTLATVKGLAQKGVTSSDFSTTSNVITLKKTMLANSKVTVSGDGYTLALANDAPKPTLQPKYWAFNKTTAYYRQDTSAGFTLAYDAKSATYSKLATENLATVSGIKKVTSANKAAITNDLTVNGQVITLGKDALATSKVTVKGDGYTFALDTDTPKPTIQPEYWAFNKTTAYYRQDTSAGFTLANDAKSAAYSKLKTETLATVSGIKKVTSANKAAIEADLTVNGKVITLGADALATSKVTVKGDGYTLALDTDTPEPELQTPYWAFNKTTAYYRQDTSAGFTLATDAKSAAYSKLKTETLATVKGIKKVTSANKAEITDAIAVSGKVITLGADALTNTKVTVTGTGYTLAMDSSLTDDTPEELWTVSGTTATFDKMRYAYFSPSANNQTFTYNKTAKLANLVKVTGLVKGATVNDDGNISDNDGKTILALNGTALTVANNDSFGNKVEVTLSNGYTLNNQLTAPAVTTTYWAVKNGTASLKQGKTDGYTLSTNAKTGAQILTYNAAKTGKTTLTLATVSGLDKTLTDTDGILSGLAYDLTGKTITADNSVLTKSNLTLKGDFTLNLSGAPTSPDPATLWEVSGTKAIYKDVKIGYFTRKNDKTFTYTKEKVLTTHATISGLRSNASLDSFTLNDGVITLTADALVENPNANTKIALITKENYTLKLADEVANVEYNDPAWTYSSGKATYKSSVKTAGYLPSDNAKTITYITTKDSKGNAVTKTLATVSGVKSASGITVDGDVIKLTAAALNNKNVTLGKNDPYTLALGDSSLAPAPLTEETWKKSSNKNGNYATLTATYSTGYTPSADSRTLNYSSKTTTKTLASINGINKNVDISTFQAVADGDTKKISLSAAQLGSKVTLGGVYEFDFANDYNNAAITGSSSADNISVAGTGLSITGGKGDDYVDFGSGANIFIYATGDGDDVIADFTTNDKIKITKGTPAVESDGEDAIVTVGAGSIKLSGAAGQTITILDTNNKAKTYSTTAPSANLLLDDNYTASAQLAEIVKPAQASYTPYDFAADFSLTKEDKLTPTISHSKDK